MAPHLTSALASYPAASTASKRGLRLLKEAGAGLGLLILVNILVLGLVGVLKGNGIPKSLANPLQLVYLPLMWVGLRWLKRRYGLASSFSATGLAGAGRRGLLALVLVGAMAAGILALLRTVYGLNFSFVLLTTEAYRWGFMALLLAEAAAVEELLFRDYVLAATRRVTRNFYVLTGLNASAFLLLHIQGFFIGDYTLLWGGAIFLIGLLLAAYVLVFRDLVFPLCFHTFWNISSTLYVEDDKTFSLVRFDHYPLHEVLIGDVTAGVCIAVTGSLFILLAWRYQRTSSALG